MKKKRDELDLELPDGDLSGNGHWDALPEEEKQAIKQALIQDVYPEIEAEVRGKLDAEYKARDHGFTLLVEHIFKTEEKYLPEMTNIPFPAIFPLSLQMMKEMVLDEERLKNKVPLSAIWRIFWMKLRRSGDGDHVMSAAKLAMEQIVSTSEGGETLGRMKAE